MPVLSVLTAQPVYPSGLMICPDRDKRRLGGALLGLVFLLGCAPTASVTQGPSSVAVASEAGSAAPSGGNGQVASVAPARWTDCGEGFLCASLRVPSDYAKGGQGTLNISLIRLPATDTKGRIGSLVINPGGPGGSGVEFIRDNARRLPVALRARFDVVGFDPRGVNSSSAIRCIDNLDGFDALDPSPDDDAELKALTDAAEAYADACGARNDATLAYLSTEAVVDDLERIRLAIGDEKLTYLGFSYGTLIGSLYADRFPDRIRAMALDGALDPSIDLEHLRSDQARAFERSLSRFLADCASRSSCLFHEGGESDRAFDALMKAIDKHDLPASRSGENRTVGPGLAASAVLSAMYSTESWPTLAGALELAQRGDGSLLLLISDPFRGRKSNGSYSNQHDAYTANTCLDFPAPTDIADYTGWAEALKKDAPHFAQQVAYNDLPCAYWPVAAQREPGPVEAIGAPAILVVGSTGDPATPYAWAESLADQLESGTLITRRGDGHTAYLASRCIQEAVDAYLLELTVPKKPLTCD